MREALAALARLRDSRRTRALAVDLRLDLYNSLLPLDQLHPLLDHLRQAETLATGLDDRHRLARARLHICHLLVLIGGCDEAVRIGHEVLTIGEAVQDRTILVMARFWVGCAYYALGDHHRTVEFLREALATLSGVGSERRFDSAKFAWVPITIRSYRSMFLAELGEFGARRPSPKTRSASPREAGMTRFALIVATGMAVMGLPPWVWAQERPWDWGWHPMWGMWGAWGVGMLLVMLTFWAFIIVGLVVGIRWLVGQGREPRRDQALEILRERYAKGEINKDEFEAKRRDLG